MIEMVVTSSVLILAILVIRRVSRGRISMKLRYALWLVVALRLLLPVSVGNSVVSVMNLMPSDWQGMTFDWSMAGGTGRDGMQISGGVDSEVSGKSAGTDGSLMTESTQPGQRTEAGEDLTANVQKNVTGRQAVDNSGMAVTEKNTDGQNEKKTESDMENGVWGSQTGKDVAAGQIPGLVFVVWLVGALAVSGYLCIGQLRFRKILLERRRVVRSEEIPQMFIKRLGVRRMRVYVVDGLASPCLVGRDVYVDGKLIGQEKKFRHVLAHEYCHARQHDVLWAFLRSALVAVYWFHPLVWAAAFAARQDSELACDEAVIHLLGERERFDYGRTLLYLLSSGGKIDCAGTALTMEGGKRGVKERVSMLAQNSGRKKWTAAAVVMVMLFVCGCAFTGSEKQGDVIQDAGNEQMPQEGENETILGQTDDRQAVNETSNVEFERIMKEYEEVVGAAGQAAEDVQKEAFEQALDYQGIMAGKDDSELSLDRKVDYQGYYEYTVGERDNPLEDGWYLVCRNEEAQTSLYGLYTQEFGFRGIKTLIGEDVNTYDMPWCPSARNESGDNIRVLEEAEDGLPRRFAFKILSVNTSDREIWNLYSGFRYDTGTVQVEELTAEIYEDWVAQYLSFEVDEEKHTLQIIYDGDMELETLDISDYQNLKVEGARLSPDVADFELDSEAYEGELRERDGGYEGIVMHLAIGLKLEGQEGVWTNELWPLAIQVLCRQGQEPAFALQKPKMDTRYTLRNLSQSRKLEEILKGAELDVQASEEDTLSRPLVNSEAGYHDLEIDFTNPCPDYDRISDGYGVRTNPVTGDTKAHNGVDMAASEGADIVAAADGTVFETGFDAANGNYVVLWHGQSGQMTYYMHCKEVLVSEGEQVSAGAKIAIVGKTGRATGSFLHFAVSYEGAWQEPLWGED